MDAAVARRSDRAPRSAAAFIFLGCAGCSHAAAGRGRCHHRRTAAHGSSPDGRGRCPSACTASCHHRGLRRGSWWRGCPYGAGSELGDDDLVDQRNVGLHIEDLGGQVNRHGLGGSSLGCHLTQAPFAAERTRTTPPRGRERHPDEEETLLDIDGVDGEVLGGLAHAAHAAGHTHPLEDATRVAQPPIEPGLRWLRWAPWEEETPWKP